MPPYKTPVIRFFSDLYQSFVCLSNSCKKTMPMERQLIEGKLG
jgi:hypothetical protein